MGRPRAEEDASRGDARTPAHIGAQGPADVGRQRKLLALLALAVDDELAAAPIDVIERQREHLARAQTQAREQQDDGDIAGPEERPSIAAVEQMAELGRGDPVWQGAGAPPYRCRNGIGQRTVDESLDEKESQESTEMGANAGERAGGVGRDLS